MGKIAEKVIGRIATDFKFRKRLHEKEMEGVVLAYIFIAEEVEKACQKAQRKKVVR